MTIQEKSGSVQKSSRSGSINHAIPDEVPFVKSPALLGPTNEEPEGNQLRKIDQNLKIELGFPDLPAGGDNNVPVVVRAMLNGSLVGPEVKGTTPLPPGWAAAQTLEIPSGIPEGRNEVRFYVEFGPNKLPSSPIYIHVDKTAPTVGAVKYPAAIKQGLDLEYFEDVSPFVLLTLDDDPSLKEEDKVEFFLWMFDENNNSVGDPVLIDTVEVKFPREPIKTERLIRALLTIDSGSVAFTARATDRTGNVGIESVQEKIPLELIRAPANFSVQIVNEGGDTTGRPSLFRDAQEDVFVRLLYDNWHPGDQLRRKFDTGSWELFDIPSDPKLVPFDDPLTYSMLLGDGNVDAKSSKYEYQIQRKTKTIPPTPLEKLVPSHLDKPGIQPLDRNNPGKRGDADPNMSIPRIQGVLPGGDRLIADDARLGAKAYLKMFEGRKKNDEVFLTIQGFRLDDSKVLEGDEPLESELAFDVPADLIAEIGNNSKMRLGCTVEHKTINSTFSVSNNKEVDVYVDERTLEQASFAVTYEPEPGKPLWIGCPGLVIDPDTGYPSVEIKYPPDPTLEGVQTTIYCQCYENRFESGENQPGDAKHDGADAVIVTPSKDDAEKGFSVFMKHDIFSKTFDGWVEIHVSATVDGYRASAQPHLYRVFYKNFDNSTCDLPTPPAK